MLTLSTSLQKLKYIGPRYATKLERLNIHNVRDLLWHFPSRYEDYSSYTPIQDLEPGATITLRGRVVSVEVRRAWRRRMTITEAIIADNSGEVRAVWFNQPYLKQTLHPGRLVNLSGKAKLDGDEIVLSHPGYEVLSESATQEESTRHTGRLVPIYPSTKGLTSRALRFFIQPLLENLPSQKEWIPKEVLASLDLPEINEALQLIHFPDEVQDSFKARERFLFENLFIFHLFHFQEKARMREEEAPTLPTDKNWLKETSTHLPFDLTKDQKKAVKEVMSDIGRSQPMNRLLQGDVGAGKTVVAALAALTSADNDHQTAFMAPTEVLATQHFLTLKKLFATLPREMQPSMALLTASKATVFYENDVEAETTKDKLKKEIKKGSVKIIIGTHALLESSVAFKKLGLIVIDEQHRFGVNQRAALLKQAQLKKTQLPHFLSMSATPIPRTLMMTLFGDLDVSLINELPKGRKPIVTKVVEPKNKAKAYGFVKAHLEAGRQAFVICPRIEKSEDEILTDADKKKLDVKSVKEEFEKLKEQIFPDFSIGMLHGQMKAKDKAKTMDDFQEGKIDLLVSTSVVEVGVDVPNATVMFIESAERFGLAQLYQFRGRVGRGKHQSYCLLFSGSGGETTMARLKALTTAKNGFELAEMDLKLRGPGQFLGTEQTGMPDELMAHLQNMELISKSRDAALQVFDKSSDLEKFPVLKEKVVQFREQLHQE